MTRKSAKKQYVISITVTEKKTGNQHFYANVYIDSDELPENPGFIELNKVKARNRLMYEQLFPSEIYNVVVKYCGRIPK